MQLQLPNKRLAMLLYGPAGVGKSVSLASLLKMPKLKVRLIVTEDNALEGLQDGFNIHGITELSEGQLIVAQVKGTGITSSETYMDQAEDNTYRNAVNLLMNYRGNDAVTGKEVTLGNVLSWKNDTVLVIDGLTMLQFACQGRGKVKTVGNSDARAAFYAGQDALRIYIYQLLQQSKANIVILAHDTTSDEAVLAATKLKGLMATHPALGTRSIVQQFMGRFNVVLYSKFNKQTKQFVWSGAEDNTMTVVRNINVKGLSHNGRQVTLNNLPADFSFEGYNFFDSSLKSIT